MEMSRSHVVALRIAAALWVFWGLVHTFAGLVVVTGDATSSLQAIADAVPTEALHGAYHPAVTGVLNQHGWNLGWFGIVTIVGAVFIWRRNTTAIWVTGLIGGLADLGYLIFLDLPGYVNFLTGTLMTLVSGSAIVLSFWVWLAYSRPALVS